MGRTDADAIRIFLRAAHDALVQKFARQTQCGRNYEWLLKLTVVDFSYDRLTFPEQQLVIGPIVATIVPAYTE